MLALSAFRFLREPSDDVVLLIHGLTTSTDMFVMPEHYNIVDYLLDHGYTGCLEPRLPDEQPALLQHAPAQPTPWTTSPSTTSPRRSPRSVSTSATGACT